jgi:hypothetical protein
MNFSWFRSSLGLVSRPEPDNAAAAAAAAHHHQRQTPRLAPNSLVPSVCEGDGSDNDDDDDDFERLSWREATRQLFGGCDNDDSSECCQEKIEMGTSTMVHIRQQESWDCGVACLQMIGHWLAAAATAAAAAADQQQCATSCVSRDSILQAAETTSIWTVDLVHVLQGWYDDDDDERDGKQQFSYLFCSKTLHLNEDLELSRYYAADFGPDRVRVSRRLQSLRDHGWPALQVSGLSLCQVVDCIARENCVAIALVDNHHNHADDNSSHLSATFGTSSSLSSYVGHFVILTGISNDPEHLSEAIQDSTGTTAGTARRETCCLVVQNPGCDAFVSYWSLARFERAWRAEGTDEDILFIVRHDKSERL